MDERPPTDNATRQPSTAALAILIAVTLLALLALGWIWFTRYAPVHFDVGRNATIVDAEGARFVLPLVFFGIFLIALAWLLSWIIARWRITFLPIVVGTIGVLALALAGYQLWQAFNADRPITVTSYICDADAARVGARAESIPDGCTAAAETGMPTIGTVSDPAMAEPDETEGAAATFDDLPPGRYNALLTVSVPDDTAEGELVTEAGDGLRGVSPLRHQEGTTWSGVITLHPNLDMYAVLFYASPYEPAPDASIRLSVQECTGTSPANFDASACEPASLTRPVVEAIPPEDDPGRPISASLDARGMTFTDLEARSYTFEPADRRATMLVIPAEGEQTASRNVLEVTGASPQGMFTIDVPPDAGEIHYVVYLFVDDSPTIATTGPAVMLSRVRP